MPKTPYQILKEKAKEKMEKDEFFTALKEALKEEILTVLDEIGLLKIEIQNVKDLIKQPKKEIRKAYPGIEGKGKPVKTGRVPTTSDYEATYKSSTEKAYLFEIKGVDMWMPKGCVKSDVTEEEFLTQTVTIQDWVVVKNLK